MSHHLNTMFGHFKMGSLKKSSKNPPEIVETNTDPEITNTETSTESIDQKRKNSMNHISNNIHGHDTNNINLNNISNNYVTQNGGPISNGSPSGAASPKKRNSMSGAAIQNSDVKNTMNSGQMNLSPRIGQRKLSADMRLRGLNPDEGDSMSYHIKPVKLKTVTTKAESYDTLHCKAAKQVSYIFIFYKYLIIKRNYSFFFPKYTLFYSQNFLKFTFTTIA